MILMGRANFVDGVPSTVNVAEFGLTPPAANYAVPGAIVEPKDVEGTLAGFIVPIDEGNSVLRGTSIDATDTLIPDPGIVTRISAAYSAPGAQNERTVDLTYDGVVTLGAKGVVKGVWKGVDILIFVNISGGG